MVLTASLCPLPCEPTEDGEGGRVDQGGSGPEHQAVGEVEARAGVEHGDAAAEVCVDRYRCPRFLPKCPESSAKMGGDFEGLFVVHPLIVSEIQLLEDFSISLTFLLNPQDLACAETKFIIVFCYSVVPNFVNSVHVLLEN